MAIFKTLLFSDGESLDPNDLNNLQDFMRSQFFDTIGTIARISESSAQNGTGVSLLEPVTTCFAVGNGGAPIPADTNYYSSPATRKVGNFRGVIMQRIAVEPANGDAPEMLAYYAVEDEFSIILAANGTGFPRSDIGCVKLDYLDGDLELRNFEDAATRVKTSQNFNKRRNVRAQFQVVVGTPGAGAPEPSVPVGYVKLWGCTVPAGASTVGVANLRDYRVPIGIQSFDVSPAVLAPSMVTGKVGGWSVSSANDHGILAAGPSSPLQELLLPCIGARSSQRLLSVEWTFNTASTANWKIGIKRGSTTSFDTGDVNGISFGYHDASSTLLPAVNSGTNASKRLSLVSGLPIWGNGRTCGPAHALDSGGLVGGFDHTAIKLLGLTTAAPGGTFGLIRFTFAGCL